MCIYVNKINNCKSILLTQRKMSPNKMIAIARMRNPVKKRVWHVREMKDKGRALKLTGAKKGRS